MKPLKHTSEFSRPPEAGRLRMGERGSKGQPVALRTWRFTSPDEQAIGMLSERFGGIPRPWQEPRATVGDQWQVTTEASEVPVLLPEGALSTFYEQWGGGGCQRRCDGVECSLPLTDDGDERKVPCVCAAEQMMQCKPKSRLSVVLPGIPFRGVWVFTTQSWNAAEELSAMEPMVQAMQGRGILRAKLAIEQRNKPGRRYMVARLVLDATPEELAGGAAGLVGIPVVTEQQALGSGKVEEGEERDASARVSPAPSSLDDDVCDAELVDEPRDEWESLVAAIVAASGLSTAEVTRGLCLSATDGAGEALGHLTPEGFGKALDKARDLAGGGHTITGVALDGRLKVARA